MRRISHIFAAVFFAFVFVVCCVACSEDRTDEPSGKHFLTFNVSDRLPAFDSAGGSKGFMLSSSEPWRIVTEPLAGADEDVPMQSWCEITPLSGEAGTKVAVRVTVSENKTLEERGLVLIARSSSCEARLEITQHRKNLILSGDNLREISGEAQSLTVEVRAAVAYKVTVEQGAEWLTEAVAPRSATEPTRHLFTVAKNPTEEKRTGVIRFRAENSLLYDDLTVVQDVWADPDLERTVLVELYEAAGGAGWLNRRNWCSDRPLGEWYGVEVDAEGHVTALRLSGNHLAGTLPERLSRLSRLQRIDLSRNSLEGVLPAKWSGLSQLQCLDLSSNALEGPIPAWDAWFDGRTTDLLLNDNLLSGEVPAFLQEHPAWNRLALGLIRQRKGSGGGLTCKREITLPAFGFTDLATGVRRGIREIVDAGRLTMLVAWDPADDASTAFMERAVRRMHTLFGAQGLAVVAFTPEGDACREAAERYLRGHEVAWQVSIGPGSDAQGRPVVLPTAPYPSYLLVDGRGTVAADIFEGSRSFPQKGDLLSFAHSDYLNGVADQLFGHSTYESRDFSQDKTFEVLQRATRGKGIELVLMGDAFTDVDIETGYYLEMMKYVMESYFAIEPTRSYRDYFTVYAVNAVSRRGYVSQSISDTALGTYKDGSRKLYFSDDSNNQYVWAIGLPGYSGAIQRAIIINGEDFGKTYMGSLIYPSYCYSGYSPRQMYYQMGDFIITIIHESVGHGLGLLADEYDNRLGEITEEEKSKLRTYQSQGLFLNVSLTDDPQQVYWSHLIGHPRYPYVGVYERGYYYSKGVWRSEQNSMMRHNDLYFNAICRELIVRRIMELSGEGFTFEKFMEKDSDEGRPGTVSARPMPAKSRPTGWKHYPPVVIE